MPRPRREKKKRCGRVEHKGGEMTSIARNRERKDRTTKKERVFGANYNPIKGLVKRHADHKNSTEVTGGLC